MLPNQRLIIDTISYFYEHHKVEQMIENDKAGLTKAKVICVTRVKNEAWIIKRFLETTSLWADKIILFDQNSEDETVPIARTFDKVTVIPNERTEYSEIDYVYMVSEARKIEGKKLIVIIDADEFLSANVLDSPEWQTVLHAKEGSLFNLRRVDFDDNFQSYRSNYTMRFWFAFMDDGVTQYLDSKVEHRVHYNRIPFPHYEINQYFLNDIVLLHYVNVNPERTLSKTRWYQCYETLYSKKTPLAIIRQYYFERRPFQLNAKTEPVETKWFANYDQRSLDMRSVIKNYDYWWDFRVLQYFEIYGTAKFKKLNIWHDKDWYGLYKNRGLTKLKHDDFKIPFINRVIRKYLLNTMWNRSRIVRLIDGLVNKIY